MRDRDHPDRRREGRDERDRERDGKDGRGEAPRRAEPAPAAKEGSAAPVDGEEGEWGL